MKHTNRDVILKIAKAPNEADLANKQFLTLTESTSSIIHNVSVTKQDMKYYSNNGETTSLVTGRQQSLSVSIDFDDADEAHKYIMSLLVNPDCMTANNQFIMLQPKANIGKRIYGKCCFVFKTGTITGNVDEVKKIEFDIFPQDKAFVIDDDTTVLSNEKESEY